MSSLPPPTEGVKTPPEHVHAWDEPCTLACPAHSNVADILAQHVLKVSRNDGCFCTCGEFSIGRGEGATKAHAAHQADVLRDAAHPTTAPREAKPWSNPPVDIINYATYGQHRVNGIAEPKIVAVDGEMGRQANPDRFFDEVIQKYGHSFKLRKNPDEKVVFPVVVVDDSEKIERLCQAMIEGTTEHDWADLPGSLSDPLRGWAWGFMQWARSQSLESRRDG